MIFETSKIFWKELETLSKNTRNIVGKYSKHFRKLPKFFSEVVGNDFGENSKRFRRIIETGSENIRNAFGKYSKHDRKGSETPSEDVGKWVI